MTLSRFSIAGRRFPFLGAHEAVVVAIILLGVIPRIMAAQFGLPEQLHPDEYVIVDGARDMIERQSFEPMYFDRPDHLEIKINYVLYVLYAKGVLGLTMGEAYAAHPGHFLFISRLVTIAFSVMLMVVCYVIGRRISRGVGLAVLATVAWGAPIFVDSTYATPDIPMAALLAAASLALMRYVDDPRLRTLGLASFLTGAAITVKYPSLLGTSVIAAAVVIVAWRARNWSQIATRGGFAIAVTIGSVFLISPNLFTNARAVQDALVTASRDSHAGADGLGFAGNLWFYCVNYAISAGIVLTAATLLGFGILIARRRIELLFIATSLIITVALSRFGLHWPRWGIPFNAAGLVCGGVGLHAAATWAWSRRRRMLAVVPVGVGIGLAVANAGALNSSTVIRGVVKDNRIVAAAELQRAGIRPENTISEGYSAFRPGRPHEIHDEFTVSAEGKLAPVEPDKRYVLLSACFNSRYFQEPDRYLDEIQFYERLRDQFTQVRTFHPVGGAPPVTWLEIRNIWGAPQGFKVLGGDGLFGCPMELYRIPMAGMSPSDSGTEPRPLS